MARTVPTCLKTVYSSRVRWVRFFSGNPFCCHHQARSEEALRHTGGDPDGPGPPTHLRGRPWADSHHLAAEGQSPPAPPGVAGCAHVRCGFLPLWSGLSLSLDKDKHALETHLLIIRGKRETHRVLNPILQMAGKVPVEMNTYFWARGQMHFSGCFQEVFWGSQAGTAGPPPPCPSLKEAQGPTPQSGTSVGLWTAWILSRSLLLAFAGP